MNKSLSVFLFFQISWTSHMMIDFEIVKNHTKWLTPFDGKFFFRMIGIWKWNHDETCFTQTYFSSIHYQFVVILHECAALHWIRRFKFVTSHIETRYDQKVILINIIQIIFRKRTFVIFWSIFGIITASFSSIRLSSRDSGNDFVLISYRIFVEMTLSSLNKFLKDFLSSRNKYSTMLFTIEFSFLLISKSDRDEDTYNYFFVSSRFHTFLVT